MWQRGDEYGRAAGGDACSASSLARRVFPTPASPSITASPPSCAASAWAPSSAESCCSRPTSGSSAGGAAHSRATGGRSRDCAAFGRRGERAVIDRAIERSRLLERCHAELPAERPHARAVLLERSGAITAPCVKADQLAVGGLSQRVEREHAARMRNRSGELAASRELPDQALEHRGQLRAESVGRLRLPVVELRAVPQREALQERALEERLRGAQRRVVGRQLAKALDVERQRRASPEQDADRRPLRSISAPMPLRSVESVRRSAPRARSDGWPG